MQGRKEGKKTCRKKDNVESKARFERTSLGNSRSVARKTLKCEVKEREIKTENEGKKKNENAKVVRKGRMEIGRNVEKAERGRKKRNERKGR